LDTLSIAQVNVAIALTSGQYRLDLPGQPPIAQGEVDEARRGGLDSGQAVGGGDVAGDGFSDLDRGHMGFASQSQGQAGGVITVLGSLGTLYGDLREGEAWQVALPLSSLDRLLNQLSDFILDHDGLSP